MLKPVRGIQLDRANPLARGLTGYWSLNEGTGNIAFDVASGNAGALQSTSWVAGGLGFDGSASYIDLARPDALQPGTGDFTVIIFLHLNAYSGSGSGAGHIGNGGYLSNQPGYIIKNTSGGQAEMEVMDDSNNRFISVTGTTALPLGTPFMLAGVVDRDKEYRLYIDDSLEAQGAISNTVSINGYWPVNVGRRPGGDRHMNGGVYGFLFFKRALAEHEIKAINADPYAVIKGGRSVGALFSAAAAAPSVVVADIGQQQLLTQPSIVSGAGLSVADILHGQAASSPAVAQQGAVAVLSVDQGQFAEALQFGALDQLYVTNTGTRTTGYSVVDDWTDANCYGTIQAAIDQAVAGDTVVVADGTYSGAGNVPFNTAGKAITLRSLNGAAGCILDGLDAARHSYFVNGETLATVIDGLHLTNGRGDYGGSLRFGGGARATLQNCIVSNSTGTIAGGGINAYSCSPHIRNCEVYGCTTPGDGGGLRLVDNTGTVFVSGCSIHNNSCTGAANDGGGLVMFGGVVEDCEIYSNSSVHGGGGVSSKGTSPASIKRTIIRNNTCQGVGGGLHTRDGSPVVAEYCLIYKNHADAGSGTTDAGGVSTWGSCNIALYNCTIYGNTTPINNLSIGNVNASNMVMTNCIVIPAAGGVAYINSTSTETITYTDISGGWAGTGNIDADPLFVDVLTDNYRLTGSSPCRDTGTTITGVTDGNDLDGNPVDASPDMGPFEYIPVAAVSIGSIFQAQGVSSSVLTQVHGLSVDAISHTQTLDAAAVVVSGGLMVNSVAQSQSSGVVAVGQVAGVLVSAVTQVQDVSAATIDQINWLAANGIAQAQGIENSLLQVPGGLTINSVSQSQSVSAVTVAQLAQIVAENLDQAQGIDNVSVTLPGVSLTVNNVGQAQALSNTVAGQVAAILTEDIRQGQSIGAINFSIANGAVSVSFSSRAPGVAIDARAPKITAA